MNIKEVFEKCNDGDYVVDNKNIKWEVIEGDLINDNVYITDFYSLKELFDLEFKKVYEIDWSKVEVDTKILVSDDNIIWHGAYFAMFENDTIYAFGNGTTSFTYGYKEIIPWVYAKLYKEGK